MPKIGRKLFKANKRGPLEAGVVKFSAGTQPQLGAIPGEGLTVTAVSGSIIIWALPEYC